MEELADNLPVHIVIDSNSRFSSTNCQKCESGVIGGTIDSDGTTTTSRKILGEEGIDIEPLFINLPHNAYGWNKFYGVYKNGCIYYKDKLVIKLQDLQKYYRGLELIDDEEDGVEQRDKDPCEVKHMMDNIKKYYHHHYYVFISDCTLDKKEDDVLEETTLYFDGHKMTNAHIHFMIISEIIK